MSDHTHVRPWRHIERRKSRQIRVGSVLVGGDAPISVQSMTNTPTSDAAATIDQIRQLEEAGADIVRVSCPDTDSTAAFKTIARESRVPLVADIHFHYKRGIEAAQAGKHILCDKPMAIRVADCERMIESCRKNGVKLGVAFQNRHHPAHAEAKRLITAGTVLAVPVFNLRNPSCRLLSFTILLWSSWAASSFSPPT